MRSAHTHRTATRRFVTDCLRFSTLSSATALLVAESPSAAGVGDSSLEPPQPIGLRAGGMGGRAQLTASLAPTARAVQAEARPGSAHLERAKPKGRGRSQRGQAREESLDNFLSFRLRARVVWPLGGYKRALVVLVWTPLDTTRATDSRQSQKGPEKRPTQSAFLDFWERATAVWASKASFLVMTWGRRIWFISFFAEQGGREGGRDRGSRQAGGRESSTHLSPLVFSPLLASAFFLGLWPSMLMLGWKENSRKEGERRSAVARSRYT